MSNQFNRDVEAALKYAKHSLEIEGELITEQDEKLIRAYLKNEISHQEFIEKAKELAKG